MRAKPRQLCLRGRPQRAACNEDRPRLAEACRGSKASGQVHASLATFLWFTPKTGCGSGRVHDAGCQSALYRVVLKPERWAARALYVYPIAPAPIVRLWFASFVYVLIYALRRLGLANAQFLPAVNSDCESAFIEVRDLLTIL